MSSLVRALRTLCKLWLILRRIAASTGETRSAVLDRLLQAEWRKVDRGQPPPS